jgi:phosphatidylglycerophosphate synthase
LAGIVYGAVTCAALTWGLHLRAERGERDELGPADWVTLARGTLVGGVAALTVDSFERPAPVALLVGYTIVALLLDGVDGQVARRTGTVSSLGARFDMEVDSALVLILGAYAARPFGGWVLTLGLMRYVFVLGIWTLPWMRGTLPPRFWRKIVAATQGVVLVAAMADVLPRSLIVTALLAALVLLLESFGRDVLWLWQHRVVTARRAARRSGAVPSAGIPGPAITASNYHLRSIVTHVN